MSVRSIRLIMFVSGVVCSKKSSHREPKSEAIPTIAMDPELSQLQKWNDLHRDTSDPFSPDANNPYHFANNEKAWRILAVSPIPGAGW